jgi:hypothetical protein
MISYIKLYGPPVYESIRALEKIAIEMPEVCIMTNPIRVTLPDYAERQMGSSLIHGGAFDYFMELGEITEERCDTIISKSGEKIGEYDFFFEWFKEPSLEQLYELVKKIDQTLSPLGVRYSIVTK